MREPSLSSMLIHHIIFFHRSLTQVAPLNWRKKEATFAICTRNFFFSSEYLYILFKQKNRFLLSRSFRYCVLFNWSGQKIEDCQAVLSKKKLSFKLKLIGALFWNVFQKRKDKLKKKNENSMKQNYSRPKRVDFLP